MQTGSREHKYPNEPTEPGLAGFRSLTILREYVELIAIRGNYCVPGLHPPQMSRAQARDPASTCVNNCLIRNN